MFKLNFMIVLGYDNKFVEQFINYGIDNDQ